MTIGFYVKNGKDWIDKDPDAKGLYCLDLTDYLAQAASTVASVTAVVAGVTLDGTAYTNGSLVCAWVAGGDKTDGAVNSITFRFTLSDSNIHGGPTVDDHSIYFKIVEK